MDAYNTALDPEKHGLSRLCRIASVYPEITEDHKLMEDVAANRGAAAFGVFDDIEAAREWIASE